MNKFWNYLKGSQKNKIFIIAILSLFFYGLFSRVFDVYYFWESLSISIGLFFVVLSGNLFLFAKENKKKLIFFLGWLCLIQPVFLFSVQLFKISNTYENVKKVLKKNKVINKEFGEFDIGLIKGISFIGTEYSRFLEIAVLLKGEKKFENKVLSFQQANGRWELIGIDDGIIMSPAE